MLIFDSYALLKHSMQLTLLIPLKGGYAYFCCACTLKNGAAYSHTDNPKQKEHTIIKDAC